MIYKISYQAKHKFIKLNSQEGVITIKENINKLYPELDNCYEMYYLDEDDCQILIRTNQDLKLYQKEDQKYRRIFIKKVINIEEELSSVLSKNQKRQNQIRTESQAQLMKRHKFIGENSLLQCKLCKYIENRHQDLLKQKVKNEKLYKIFIKQAKQNQYEVKDIHDVPCSKCETIYICGIRYQCPYCFYFNLCQSCEEIQNHEHSLLKIKKKDDSINYQQLRDYLNLNIPSSQQRQRQRQLIELKKRVIQMNLLIQQSDKAWIKRDIQLKKDISAINNALQQQGSQFEVGFDRNQRNNFPINQWNPNLHQANGRYTNARLINNPHIFPPNYQ